MIEKPTPQGQELLAHHIMESLKRRGEGFLSSGEVALIDAVARWQTKGSIFFKGKRGSRLSQPGA